MRLRHNFKSRIAAAMAAVMVFSMAAPALPVYAATATITFDTGDGPGVTYGGYTSNTFSGEVGTLLRDVPGFAGIPLVHPDGTPAAAGDSDARPAFPILGSMLSRRCRFLCRAIARRTHRNGFRAVWRRTSTTR